MTDDGTFPPPTGGSDSIPPPEGAEEIPDPAAEQRLRELLHTAAGDAGDGRGGGRDSFSVIYA
ncbi:MAG TPA: hypothetical protein VKI19_11855, partial [Acidimicrobiales bacterium]|nr:hypothetical protein [Acidimicrobiales bacterium]